VIGPTDPDGKKHDKYSDGVDNYKLLTGAALLIVFALVGLKAFGKNWMSR